jgi:hypothetical protein
MLSTSVNPNPGTPSEEFMPEDFMLGEIGYVVACARSAYTALLYTAAELEYKPPPVPARPRSNTTGAGGARGERKPGASQDLRRSVGGGGARERAATGAGRRKPKDSEADRLMSAMRKSGFM